MEMAMGIRNLMIFVAAYGEKALARSRNDCTRHSRASASNIDAGKTIGRTVVRQECTRRASDLRDTAIYALRNMVERRFNTLTNTRKLATRYAKTANSYFGFIRIVSIRRWMRQFVNAS